MIALSLVAEMGIAGSVWAARRARRLPKYLWAKYPLVSVKWHSILYNLDLRDNVQRSFYFTGWYEKRYIQYLIKSLRESDVMIDVGAHIGIHSSIIASKMLKRGSGMIVAFEPYSKSFQILSEMVKVNNLSNIMLVQRALDEGSHQIPLKNDPQNFHELDSAILSSVGPGLEMEIASSISFDEWMATKPIKKIDIIKIDVEGMELKVLKGMVNSIMKYKPRIIGVEIRKYLLERMGVQEADIYKYFSKIEYTKYEVGDLEGNFIFVRSPS